MSTSAGTSFGAAASEYERGRPVYPVEAVEWLLPPGATRVLDLGAGTGKLTRRLLERGLRTAAIDPSVGMLAQLTSVLPGVPVAAGTAELLPVRDAAVDAVLVAQAWHWIDAGRAVPRIARALRPGGRLGLVWNIRDEREDWVARLGRIMHQRAKQDMGSEAPPIGSPFGPAERRDFTWTRRMTLPELLDMVASRSYVIALPPGDRAAILAAVTRLVETHPELDPGHIRLPYVTRCTRASLSR